MSTADRYAHLDEDDVRVRGRRGKSRPRTKVRPRHRDAVLARVLTVDRGRYHCLPEPGTAGGRGEATDGHEQVVAMRARELRRTQIVVGDLVSLVGDSSGDEGTLARIVRVRPRTSVLRRSADDTDPVERVLVANADQLAVVTAVAEPEPRLGLIDRCLVAAFDAGIHPLLIVTKTDLGPAEALREAYSDLDVATVERRRGADLEPVLAQLRGHRTVLVGHSGVGKSTLVNELLPDAGRATGAVNAVTGRGRHTSSSALALPLPDQQGWLVDTPGIRSFGLAHVDRATVVAAFPDLAPGTGECPRACSHCEPTCGLDRWVAHGHAAPARLASLRRLLAGLDEAGG